jgi:hypothetical protein
MRCRHVRAAQPAGAVRGGQPGTVTGHRRAGRTAPRSAGGPNAQGIEVKDRGRVPADLVARFKAATLK